MSYTVSFELGKPNRDKECKVYVMIFSDGKKLPREDTGVRKELRGPTKVEIRPDAFFSKNKFRPKSRR